MKRLISALFVIIILLTALCSTIQTSAQEIPLPSAYNADPENPMYVTSVKNQGDYGICWAFAAIACCESEAIKNHGADPEEIDLSELHLAYFAYNSQDNGSGDEIITTAPFYNIGGDISLPIFTLSKWIGLVDESVADFEAFAKDPTKLPDASLQYGNNEYYVKNAYSFKYAGNINSIKNAIMEYGAVQSAYYADDAYLNNSTAAYCCTSALDINHAITIIGWDDNYSKENFKQFAKPSNDGAWLVKNSWGENEGINGYFWISYEDQSITSAVAYDVEPASSFEPNNIYQHDGGFSLISFEYDTVSIANIFKAESDEELLSVGVFTFDANNTPYNLKIFVNPDKLSPEEFFDDDPVYTQNGIISGAGFETIPLSSSVLLSEGDTFIVCLETAASIGIDAFQELRDQNSIIAISNATAKPNQTYICINNSGFYDTSTTENGATPFNARVKAYTRSCNLGEAILKSLPTMKSIEYGQTLRSASLVGGSVIDSLHNTEIRGSWSFKNPSLIPENGDTLEIIFTPEDSYYQSFSETVTASVTPSSPIITLGFEKTSYSKTDPLKLTISIKNKYSDVISSFGTVSYTYTIEGEEPIPFDGTLFPGDEMSGKHVTITATVSSVDGKYFSATKDISFNVPAGSGSTNTEAPKETQDNTQNDSMIESEIIQSDSITDTELNESEADSIRESIEESVEESVRESVKDKMLDSISCFSSASISAIFTVCALVAGITLKKKRH